MMHAVKDGIALLNPRIATVVRRVDWKSYLRMSGLSRRSLRRDDSPLLNAQQGSRRCRLNDDPRPIF